MNKDKFLILVIIILFALNLFTLGFVLFGRPPIPPPPGPPFGMEHKRDGRPDDVIINRLKLTPDQQKKFEDLKKEHRGQVENIQEQSRKLHDEYFGLLKSEQVNTSKADSLLQLIANNQKELDKVTFTHFEKIRAICDANQKVLFSQFIDEIAHSFKPPMHEAPPPPR